MLQLQWGAAAVMVATWVQQAAGKGRAAAVQVVEWMPMPLCLTLPQLQSALLPPLQLLCPLQLPLDLPLQPTIQVNHCLRLSMRTSMRSSCQPLQHLPDPKLLLRPSTFKATILCLCQAGSPSGAAVQQHLQQQQEGAGLTPNALADWPFWRTLQHSSSTMALGPVTADGVHKSPLLSPPSQGSLLQSTSPALTP